MLFTAYEALLSPHVRLDERTDAAVCPLFENGVDAERAASYRRATQMVPAVKNQVIETKLEFCDARH